MSTSSALPIESVPTPAPFNQPDSPAHPDPSAQPETSAAIQRCIDAWRQQYRAVMAKENNSYAAERLAGEAYRAAMPDLTNPANLRVFIACVSRGILLGAIDDKRASKLLYATQVASGAFGRQAKSAPSKSPAKTANSEL